MAIVNASDDVTIPSDDVGDASYIESDNKKENINTKHLLLLTPYHYQCIEVHFHTMLSVRIMHACCGDADSGLGELSREEDGDSFSLWPIINDGEDKFIWSPFIEVF